MGKARKPRMKRAYLKKYSASRARIGSRVDKGRLHELYKNKVLYEPPEIAAKYRGVISVSMERAAALLRGMQLSVEVPLENHITLVDKKTKILELFYTYNARCWFFVWHDLVNKERYRSIEYASKEDAIQRWTNHRIVWVQKIKSSDQAASTVPDLKGPGGPSKSASLRGSPGHPS